MATIKLVSLMADNATFFYQAVANYLAQRAELDAVLVTDLPWGEREYLLDQGQAQVGFICGLPYTRRADTSDPSLTLLAAPVMADRRYAGKPIYFSDVVVHQASSFHSFADLRGTTWAYNEPGSFSGYAVVKAYLARLGVSSGYFGRALESGAHQASLHMVATGAADASAIDSTVLALEIQQHPELHQQIRVVASLGPSPIPPVVVRCDVAVTLQKQVRAVLLGMHEDEAGRSILASGNLARFVAVDDQDYDAIRRTARLAENVKLSDIL